MASLIGKTLKNCYRVDESLGHGGMAEVYKVWDLQRGVPLSMKVLREDLAEDIVFLRRFEREAKNLTRLQHPNIVRCYGLEREGHTAFMLMDYIDGWTLRSEIFDAHGPLSMDRILEIMQPVCSALNYAHQMGMVHCDVKSANIMISKNGTVYLTDFGIARGMDTSTSTMVGIGTPAYMAPELIKGQDPTPQTDIYALGIVLYEMLTGGERPFTGERATTTGSTADKVKWEHLSVNPLPIHSFNPRVPSNWEKAILICLEKDPQRRFSSTLELLSALGSADKKELEETFIPIKPSISKIGNVKRSKISRWYLAVGFFVILIGIILLSLPKRTGSEKIYIVEKTDSIVDVSPETSTISEDMDQIAASTQEVIPTDIVLSNVPTGKIVFTCQVDKQVNHDQICIMNADGSGWQQLTNDLYSEHFYPNITPDGRKILYVSSQNGGSEIFEMNLDGSDQHQITWGLGECYSPELSPNGSTIVFTLHISNTNYIATIDWNGGNLQILNDYYDCKDPTWSPDGSQILFAASPNQVPQFFIMNADGSNTYQVTNIDGIRGRSDWSVDGTLASYRGQTSEHNRELFIFGEGISPVNITSGGDNLAPSFSSDGEWIAFMSYRDHYWESDGCEIYVMRLEDGYTLRLTNNDYCDYQPRWGD